MTRIVCQVIPDKPDQLTFTWSAEGGFFKPYSLSGMDLQTFHEVATNARHCLADLVKDWLAQRDDDLRKDALAVARAGYDLYRAVLFPDAEQADEARNVRTWLDELRKRDAPVESLEFVLDTECFIPWNIVYDQKPAPQAFLQGDALDRWLPFWGIRYNVACSRRANPLRRLPEWDPPNVFLVVDPAIRNGLPDDARQRRRLAEFARRRGLSWVESRAQLVAALKPDRPYLIYWLSHATPDALVLGEDEITPADGFAHLFKKT